MNRRPQGQDYEGRELTLLTTTEKAVLMRNEDTGRKGWIPKCDIIRFDKLDRTPVVQEGTYNVVAYRYIFQREGLL